MRFIFNGTLAIAMPSVAEGSHNGVLAMVMPTDDITKRPRAVNYLLIDAMLGSDIIWTPVKGEWHGRSKEVRCVVNTDGIFAEPINTLIHVWFTPANVIPADLLTALYEEILAQHLEA
jgi:hypothetical protein